MAIRNDGESKYLINYRAYAIGKKPAGSFELEKDRATIIHGCIQMMDIIKLPWIEASSHEWSRTFYPGTLWLTGSGFLISRQHSEFRPGMTEEKLV